VHGFVGPVGACSCLSAFVMVSCSGPVVSFAEFPDCLRSVGSDALQWRWSLRADKSASGRQTARRATADTRVLVKRKRNLPKFRDKSSG
jgi:hypothetical protein